MLTAEFLRQEAVRIGLLPRSDGMAEGVLLVAERIFADHPEWTVRAVYREVIASTGGRGLYRELWQTLRGRTPQEVEA